MAVIQMKRMILCALKKNRKQILEDLQRRGVVEVSNTDAADGVFQKMDLSDSRAAFAKNVAAAKHALEILDRIAPESRPPRTALEGKKQLTARQYEEFAGRHDETARLAGHLEDLDREAAENRAEITRTKMEREALEPWMELDLPLDFPGTETTAALIGSLPELYTLEELSERLAQAAPEAGPFQAKLISTSQNQTFFLLICEKKGQEKIEAALTSLGFARPAVQTDSPPKQQAEVWRARAEQCASQIERDEKEVRSCSGRRSDLELLVDYDTMRSEKYEVIGRLAQSRRTFLLTGYLPAKKTESLTAELSSRFDLAVEFFDPGEEEDVPVALQNNAFSTPVENVVESFSLPGKGEIDPTALIAPFYYFMYGMMLGDAAYGLIITIVTLVLLKKFPNMKRSLRESMKMFFYCGISTIFWGVMFGSYFGDVVDVVGKTFFHADVTIPAVWFPPLNQPMRLLVFCLLVGVIHIFAGLGANLYQSVKAGKYRDALYDVVLWYLLITSLIVLLLSTKMIRNMFGLTFVVPAGAVSVSVWVAVVSAAGIVLTGGRDSRNPFIRIAKGLYSLYNITGYLSDILSYSRLLALGLATSVIASVINKIGSMAGGGVFGAVLFILVFIIGHPMNMAINMLGAYVHTNRLQYVELFGKFYSGGGRKFHPFSASAHTQYYQFKEDE